MEVIHSTIGVYLNDRAVFKYNGVRESNLKEHIEYNRVMRFGRALFVDGKCAHRGYLSDDRICSVEKFLSENPHVPVRDTQPYV